jgi:hypothetical protein
LKEKTANENLAESYCTAYWVNLWLTQHPEHKYFKLPKKNQYNVFNLKQKGFEYYQIGKTV